MVISKRIFIFTFVLLISMVQWTGVSQAVTEKAKSKWKMATHAPETIGYAVYIKDHLNPALKEATNGEVAFDWYWGGIMGDDEDWIAKIKIGQLQGGGFDGHGIVLLCPEIAVLELPFLFDNSGEAIYVRKKLESSLENIFKKKGYKMLFLADQGDEGFDEIYSTKRPIRTPEDFKKSRILTWCGEMESETLKALGASPIPVNVPEVVSNIRSGVCDVALAPGLWWVGTQLYTITKYLTPWKLRYQPGGILVSMDAWTGIPEEYQSAIEERMPEIQDGLNQCGWDVSKKCVLAMIKYGVKEVKLTPDEIDVLKKKTRPVWDRLAGKLFSRELFNEVLLYLEEYRSKDAIRANN